MHVDNTQEQFHPPTAPVPRTPTIQFRPSPMDNTLPPFVSPAKKAKSSPGKDPKTGKKKKSDALSMLAKVSTAMADPKEEAEKAAAAQKEMEQQQQVQHLRSPQRQPEQQHSPVVMWTTPRPSERVQSRQITPTSTYENHRHMPPPPRAGYNNNYAPPQQQQPYPPRYASSYPPPSYNAYRGDSPPAVISERGSFEEHSFGSPPRHEDPRFSPYTYVQQPRLEDKTILRKKFSWKHFPELERFLIANRDEYLRHSALNYTAEQKQYNNWLTERLLEVAARYHYLFDPDDFNFVAVRDRIRCYYKSFVQTARKRGLPADAETNEQQKQAKARIEAE